MAEAQRLAARRAFAGLGRLARAAIVDGTWDFVWHRRAARATAW